MMPSCLRSLCLLALVLLLPSAARADGASDALLLEPGELRPGVLRDVIGVATLQGTLPETGAVEGDLPRFVLQGERFVAAGVLALAEVRAVSGFDLDGRAVRRVPVRAQHGRYVEVVVDAQTGRREWLRLTPGRVQVLPLSQLGAAGLGVGFLGRPLEQVRVLAAAADDAPEVALSEELLEGELVFGEVDGSGEFVRVELRGGLDGEPESVGWVRLYDEDGQLRVWPLALPCC